MLFGVGRSGAALDPYSLIEAYTGANYRYNLGWDAEHTNLTVNFDGKDYTATVWEWTQALGGAEIEIKDADGNKTSWAGGSSDNVPEQRFQVLCALENAILETYDMIPVMDNSAANLKGMQIEYYSEEYVYAMGFGGVQYYTYNYSDAEWADFVASQGGSLNYN